MFGSRPQVSPETAQYAPPPPTEIVGRVRVTSIDLSIDQMCWLMVKAALASIPALIILVVAGVLIIGVVGATFTLPK